MTPAELQAWADGEALGFFGPDPAKTLLRASFAAALVSAYQEGHAACLAKVRTYADDVEADGLDDDAATARVIADMIEEGSL